MEPGIVVYPYRIGKRGVEAHFRVIEEKKVKVVLTEVHAEVFLRELPVEEIKKTKSEVVKEDKRMKEEEKEVPRKKSDVAKDNLKTKSEEEHTKKTEDKPSKKEAHKNKEKIESPVKEEESENITEDIISDEDLEVDIHNSIPPQKTTQELKSKIKPNEELKTKPKEKKLTTCPILKVEVINSKSLHLKVDEKCSSKVTLMIAHVAPLNFYVPKSPIVSTIEPRR
jgi:hypothetical protein